MCGGGGEGLVEFSARESLVGRNKEDINAYAEIICRTTGGGHCRCLPVWKTWKNGSSVEDVEEEVQWAVRGGWVAAAAGVKRKWGVVLKNITMQLIQVNEWISFGEVENKKKIIYI